MSEFPAHVFTIDGNPSLIRGSAQRWASFSEAATSASEQITSLDTSQFVGPEGDQFREGLNAEMPEHLRITGEAFGMVAQALSTFADQLSSLQTRMRPLAAQAPGLWEALQAAHGRVERAQAADAEHARQASNSPDGAADTYQSDTPAATAALASAQQAWDTCYNAAQGLRSELDDAVSACVSVIREAEGMRFRENPKWWDLPGQFTNFVRDHADVLSAISTGLKIVSAVAGLLSFIPVLAPVMGPIAMITGAGALLIDASLYVATGQGSLTSILIDTALTVIPGGRLLGLGARTLRAAGDLLPTVGRLGPRFATNIRNGLNNLADSRVFSRVMNSRTTVGDPVDVVTGEVVQSQVDVELPGVLPLRISRTHLSSYRVGHWYGSSWASTLDQRLEVDEDGMYFAGEDGVLLVYPIPDATSAVMPLHGPRWPLAMAEVGYTITDPRTGQTLHFANPAGATVGSLPTLPRPTGDDTTDQDTGAGTDASPSIPQLWRLSAITDRRGNRIAFLYDSDGVPAEIRHSGGYRIAIDSTDGLVTALRLLDGDNDDEGTVLIRYGYDGERLTEVINSSGQPLRFFYDDEGRLTGWEDRNGTRYEYVYDERGRCVQGTGPALSRTFEYHHPSGEERGDPTAAGDETWSTVEIDSLGHRTVYQLNHHYQVVRRIDPLGNITVYEWDAFDRKTAETDPLGRTTRWTYDDAGNLVSVTYPDGSVATAVYNDLGLPVQTTAVDGTVWQRQWDEAGNLVSVTDPTGATTRYTYDAHGGLATVTDALGNVTQVRCNAAGLPVEVTEPDGAVTRYQRDAAGRVVTVTDPVGGVTRYAYSPEGKLISCVWPDGAEERWTWDGEGNLVAHTDPLGGVTRFEMAPFDVPAARVTPDGARLEFRYDTELRLVSVTNPHGLVWQYDYDPAGRLITETDFNGRTIRYDFDAAGQLIARTNGAGQTTRYRRDVLGRVTVKEAPEGDTVFSYDPAGRLIAAASPDVSLVLERDPLGRVIAETCEGRTLRSTYDALGRRVSRITPSNVESQWEYGAGPRPVALWTAGQVLRFEYDAAGREILRRTDAGFSLTQTWDSTHRLTSQTVLAAVGPVLEQPATVGRTRLVQRRTYTYRSDGYVTRIDDQLRGVRTFELDSIGRVREVRGAEWTERYAYDPTGNLTEALWPIRPNVAGGADRLAGGGWEEQGARGGRRYTGTLLRAAGAVRYEYDAQGRVVLRQQKRLSAKPLTWRYEWDSDDQLVGVTTPTGERWRYRYDALGRRVAKQRLDSDGRVIEETTFVWDAHLLAERIETRDGQLRTTAWDWEPDAFRPVSQIETRAPSLEALRDAPQAEIDRRFYTIVADLTGTPAELVTPAGELAWRTSTTLWGTTYTDGGEVDCPLRFPGQYHDPETGLHYNYFRYYDPGTAQYLSADPLGAVPNPNSAHAYVSNPTFEGDPFGLSPYQISNTRGLTHSFDRHAAQWFGRPVPMETHLGQWENLIRRASTSSISFPWSTGTAETIAHLARIEGKRFVVQFFRDGGRANELATAFVPTRRQVSAMLRVAGLI